MRPRTLALVCVAAASCGGDVATAVDPPMLNITLAPRATATFPAFSSARITTAPAHDTLEFTVVHLPPTGLGNTYQIALVDTVSGRGIGVISRVIRSYRGANGAAAVDTTVGAQFSVPDTATVVAVRMVSPAVATYTHLVLRSAGEGSVPTQLSSTARTGFLAFRFRAGTTYGVQIESFGAWAISSAARLRFAPTGTATSAGVLGESVRLDFANLLRPPAGFRYSAWLVNDRTAAAVRLGGLIAPAPSTRSLDDADLGDAPWLTASTVLAARVRANLTELSVSRRSYTSVVLALESYGGFGVATQPGTAYVLAGPLP